MDHVQENAPGDLIAKDDFETRWEAACAAVQATDEVRRRGKDQWKLLRRISDQEGGHKIKFGTLPVRVKALRRFQVWERKLERNGVAVCKVEAERNRRGRGRGGLFAVDQKAGTPE